MQNIIIYIICTRSLKFSRLCILISESKSRYAAQWERDIFIRLANVFIQSVSKLASSISFIYDLINYELSFFN